MAFGVGLEHGSSISDIKMLIERRHPELQCMGLAESVRKNDLLRIAEAFIWAISIVALTVGGIGAFNTMSMSVFERTKEIGILRSLGWPGSRIFIIVMTEGLILGVIGGMLGCVVGIGLDHLIEATARVRGMIVSAFTWQLCLKALIVATFLGSFGGVYPAWKATRISPVIALRSE